MIAEDNDKERQSDLDKAQANARYGRDSAPKTDKAWEPTPIASAKEQIKRGRSTQSKKLDEVQNIVAAMGPQAPRQFASVSQAIGVFQQELKAQAAVIAMLKAEQDQLRNRLDATEEELEKAQAQPEQPTDQRVHIPMGKQSFGLKLVGNQATIYVGSIRAHGDKVIEIAKVTKTINGSVVWLYAQFTRGASSGTIQFAATEPTTGAGSKIVKIPLYKLTITAVANVWELETDRRNDINFDTGI